MVKLLTIKIAVVYYLYKKERYIMNDDLKTKTVDITVYSFLTALLLLLAVSFFNDAKKDSTNQLAKVMTGLCLFGTGITGTQSVVDIKKYRDIKNELSKKAKEKQK